VGTANSGVPKNTMRKGLGLKGLGTRVIGDADENNRLYIKLCLGLCGGLVIDQ